MTTKPIIYLAGGIAYNTFDEATQWRRQATDYLSQYNIETRDPMRGKRAYQWADGEANHDHPGFSASDIFHRDIADIDESTALLINMESVRSVGTPWEMGYAYALGKPLFIVAPLELLTHPFICVPAYMLTNKLSHALEAIAIWSIE